MIGEAFDLIVTSITNAIAKTDLIFSSMGDTASAILAVFVIYTSYRFFLKPLLGGAGSDYARKKKSGSDNE